MFASRKKRPSIDLSKLSSLIAADVVITGDLGFSGGLRIDGCVKGNLIAQAGEGQGPALLVLSESGQLHGSVRCGNAVINGLVEGDLVVEHFLELQSRARVSGSIRYRHLQMDVGAVVRGQLHDVPDASTAGAGNVVAMVADKVPATPVRAGAG